MVQIDGEKVLSAIRENWTRVVLAIRGNWARMVLAVALVGFLVFLLVLAWQQPRQDVFGIDRLYPSPWREMHWEAKWTDDEDSWSEDPWVEQGSKNVHYRTREDVLAITGETSRLYIRDPEKKRQWGDVEVTVYAKRLEDDGVPYSGIVTEVRANHGMTGDIEDNPCDSRGLSARLRFDGTADFGKETKHPTTVATHPVTVFPNGLPYGEWIGYKHVVYDIDGGSGTRQELWMDLTDGKDGGDWKLIATHEDHLGDEFGDRDGFGEDECAPGVDTGLPLTKGERPGSESGLPNLSVFFRADSIGFDGMEYKWASVREIEAPPSDKEIA